VRQEQNQKGIIFGDVELKVEKPLAGPSSQSDKGKETEV
jgi:hypothetical protein